MARHPTDRANVATANNVLKARAILWLMCGNCDHEGRVDLAAIVQRGLGHVPIIELKFRCSACGSKTVHPRLSSASSASSASADRYRPPRYRNLVERGFAETLRISLSTVVTARSATPASRWVPRIVVHRRSIRRFPPEGGCKGPKLQPHPTQSDIRAGVSRRLSR